MARLRLCSLTAARRGTIVARDVSLEVHPAEVTALVGPSGSGKSSILRTIVRLDEPAGGRVELDGRDVSELEPAVLRRRVGLVTQRPVMLPGTVRENLAYGLDRPDEAGLAGALAAVGLADGFLDRDASALSGGEMARVAVARALTRAPDALLLDEPTAALDAGSARAIEELVGSLAARGLAIVVVTHDEASARRMAQAAVRLQGGRVTARGPAEAVLAG